MNRQVDPRRIGLTLLFVMWLSVQTLVVGFSPTWGFVLPHEHIMRGTMSDAAWRTHMREHQRGSSSVSLWNCNEAKQSSSDVISSVPESAGAFSFVSFAAATLHDPLIPVPGPSAIGTPFASAEFYALDVFVAPLEPPPTA